ncbi:MAG TPA: exodeoxyribonuclease VII small subunit [Acidimicrobiales bacterium]|nr:exodeoxyribonuclease VII small subunit [Acidimicrobiales bacterium]
MSEAARTFEQVVEELEAVVSRLASGAIGIEEATDLYEQAEGLHAEAAARLQVVQDRITRLADNAVDPREATTS